MEQADTDPSQSFPHLRRSRHPPQRICDYSLPREPVRVKTGREGYSTIELSNLELWQDGEYILWSVGHDDKPLHPTKLRTLRQPEDLDSILNKIIALRYRGLELLPDEAYRHNAPLAQEIYRRYQAARI